MLGVIEANGFPWAPNLDLCEDFEEEHLGKTGRSPQGIYEILRFRRAF